MSDHLTTSTAVKATQLVEEYGLDDALLFATNKIGSLKDASTIFGMSNTIADNLGYWQEVKQSIEFKINENEQD